MNVGDSVLVVKKDNPRGYSWASPEMDELINHTGIIENIKDNGYGVKIFRVKFPSSLISYWFSGKSIQLTTPKEWYISSISNLPYKFIGKGISYLYFEDSNGNIFSNERLGFHPAPQECSSFEWRAPKKPALIY